MKKVFMMVAAVLAAANLKALEEPKEDGSYALDEAQVQALEDALAQAKADKEAAEAAKTAAETAKADAETKLAAANARIKALEAEPAKPADHVVDTKQGGEDDPENPAEKLQANIAEARRMLGKKD